MTDAGPFPPKLTERQREILELIQTAVKKTGAPPTRAEIANALGFRSANAAEEHLQALARKGAIELVSGTSRGIRLKQEALKAIHDSRLLTPSTLSAITTTALALPLIGKVAAGSPVLAQEHIDRVYHVDVSMFEKTPTYLLRVKGMSMRDAGILDGDLLAVHATKNATSGQIVVARLGDDVTVKRLWVDAAGIELRPENPEFSPLRVQSSDRLDIEGLAVGLIRDSFKS
jgi:repressor LexA